MSLEVRLADHRLVLTRAEVADLLHVHPRTVGRLPIPSVVLGKGNRLRRWRLEDVKRFIEERTAA